MDTFTIMTLISYHAIRSPSNAALVPVIAQLNKHFLNEMSQQSLQFYDATLSQLRDFYFIIGCPARIHKCPHLGHTFALNRDTKQTTCCNIQLKPLQPICDLINS